MPGETDLTYESFLTLAEVAGMETGDAAHMQQLYVVVKAVLPFRQEINKLDLTNVEPLTIYLPRKE